MFDTEFQKKVFFLLLTDPGFFRLTAFYVEPEFFEYKPYADIWSVIKEWSLREGKPPTVFIAKNEIKKSKKISERLKGSYIELLSEEVVVTEVDYILSEFLNFIKHQKLKEVIKESVDLVESGDYDEVEKRVRGALRVGRNVGIGQDYFKEVEQRVFRRSLGRSSVTVPTLITDLDFVLNGGLANSELGVILGSPEAGKSICLTHLGKAGILSGENVWHYTFEMREEKVSDRYDSSFTGIEYRELFAEGGGKVVKVLREKLGKLKSTFNKKLLIKYFPTKGCTVNDIRRHLEISTEELGVRPGLIVIDYADIMRSTRRFTERREEEGYVYEELKGLAGELDLPIWTASQATRASLMKKKLSLADVAESYDKARISDVIVALCQTESEKFNRELRLVVCKNRDSISGSEIPIKTDFFRIQFARKEEFV